MFATIKTAYYSRYINFFVWLLAATFYSLQMTLRILPAMMMDYLTVKIGMNAEEFGLLAGFYYVGYAGMQIPVGVLLDKFHPKFVIAACILTCVIGILMTIHSTDKTYLYISRILIGVGSLAGILGSVKAIDDFFPKKYSVFLGFTVFCGVFGAYYGGAPIAKSFTVYGVEKTLLLLTYIALALCLAILIFYRKSYTETKIVQKLSIIEIAKSSLSNKKLWIVGLLGGLMVGPMGGFADMWAGKYLVQVKGLTQDDASFAVSLIFLGLGLGSSITGYIAQYFKSFSKLIIYMGIMQVLVMLTLFAYDADIVYLVYFLTFLVGLLSSYQVAAFSLGNKFSKNHMIGVVTSLINSLIMSFCFLFNYFIGLILRCFFESKSHDKLIYDEAAFHTSFSLILLCVIIGIVGFFIMSKKERQF